MAKGRHAFFSLLKIKNNFYLKDVLKDEALGIISIRKAYDLIESISMCKGNAYVEISKTLKKRLHKYI
ncbi:hypothetical protein EXW32_11910 [Bacillus mycoides]|jgi:hypothetical protein|uniref:Uncharacterized protein n=1 Tax=Bacillus mycoides TaxID=1405 RepID=A0AAP7W7W9_BACMY|nr:hypothetical protein [Bacillus sp. TH50]EEL99470.1 hypothetical protein bmyco0001_21170 [Bacillus mycoides DSM 2048]KIV74341.1 hypothetical protein SZ39_1728 [Bacillus mycoides]KZD28182.1 hypothetical protein B4083_5151 [Bacillus cereus]MBK5360253.1 hypothetical protein [Bacillus sp. TH44]RAN91719.1 hypothetical protein B5P41_01835 [Bacillus sp. SRB_28]TXR79300.1 hypothetical protein DN408_16820 [Bacillus sp. AR13-1]